MRPTVAEAPNAHALQETFFLFRRIMLGFKTRFKQTLAAHDLTFPQWMVLMRVADAGRLTVRELAESLDVTPANITGIIDRMERSGLATRSRSDEDRRVIYVRLTEAGHRRFETVKAAGDATVLKDAFEGWSADDLARFQEMLRRVTLDADEC